MDPIRLQWSEERTNSQNKKQKQVNKPETSKAHED